MQEAIFCYLVAGLHVAQCFYQHMDSIEQDEIGPIAVILATLFWPVATVLWVLEKCTAKTNKG